MYLFTRAIACILALFLWVESILYLGRKAGRYRDYIGDAIVIARFVVAGILDLLGGNSDGSKTKKNSAHTDKVHEY